MPNAHGAGYYRFEVPKEKFSALIDDAETLDAAEALALADSFGASYAAGRISAKDYLAVLPAFTAHRAWDVAAAPLVRLETILDQVLTGSARETAREQVRRAYAPWIQRFGIRDRCAAGDTLAVPSSCDSEVSVAKRHEAAQLREVLVPFLALHAEDDALRAELVVIAEQVLAESKDTTWSPALTRAALAVFAQTGGEPAFVRLMGRFRETKSNARREDILSAVGSVTEASVVSKARKLVLGDELDADEAMALLSAQADVTANVATLWAWEREHLPELLKRFTDGHHRSDLIALAARLCTSAARNQVRAAFAPYLKDMPSGDSTLESAVDAISHCAMLTGQESVLASTPASTP